MLLKSDDDKQGKRMVVSSRWGTEYRDERWETAVHAKIGMGK